MTCPGCVSHENRYSKWPLYATWVPLPVRSIVTLPGSEIAAVGSALRSGGQACAQAPVHVLMLPLSDESEYRAIPLVSTRIFVCRTILVGSREGRHAVTTLSRWGEGRREGLHVRNKSN